MPHHHKRRTGRINSKDRKRKMRKLLARDGDLCHWCQQPMAEEDPPTFDHLIPRVVGGSDHCDNLVLAHAFCNNARANPKLGRRRTKEDGVVIVE